MMALNVPAYFGKEPILTHIHGSTGTFFRKGH
jgi:hypothetical protein